MIVQAIVEATPSDIAINEKKFEMNESEIEKVEDKELTPPSTPRTVISEDTEENKECDSKDDIVEMDVNKQENDDMKSNYSDTMDIAMSLFQEKFVLIRPEEYTQYLASTDEENSKVRAKYMDLFEWKSNVLESTRILCSKLYLKGESQEIDRILTAFTKSYLKQNPSNVFCTRDFEKMYIIIYSLILLNTALHNSEVNTRSKISQTEYVRNTFSTFVKQSSKTSKALSIRQRIIIERELSNYYDDLLHEELHLKQLDQPTSIRKYTRSKQNHESVESSPSKNAFIEGTEPLSRQVSASSIWSTNSNHRSSLAINRISTNNTKNYEIKTQSPRGFTRALLTEQNQKLNRSPVKNPVFSHLHSGSNSLSNKRGSRASVISKESGVSTAGDDISMLSFDVGNLNTFDNVEENIGYQNLEDFKVDDYQDSYDLTLELAGSPYLKEGLLKVKILNNDDQDSGVVVETNTSSSASFMSTNSSVSTASKILSFFRSSISSPAPTFGTRNTSKTAFLANKFTENFVVASKGELSIYSFDPKVIKKEQERKKKLNDNFFSSYEEDTKNLGDGNWLKNAVNVGNYNLCSTFAKLEGQSGYSNKQTYRWSLTFSKISKREPMKIIFEAGTKEIALEFINTCNFWASKITAIPTLEEIVSSIEYGWNDLDGLIRKKDQLKKLKNIQKWEPLPKGIYLSAYVVNGERGDGYHEGMMKQFFKTLKYYKHLKSSFHEFSAMRKKFLMSFSLNNSSNCSKILNNYDNKIAEYRQELAKYKDYLVILAYGLQLRFDLEAKDREIEDENEEDDELNKIVKCEIIRLLAEIKNINNVIPTFYSNENAFKDEYSNPNPPEAEGAFPLVKSPKTFTLSNFKDNQESVQHIGKEQLAASEMGLSYSTNTIKEEEEPEEEEPLKSNFQT